MRCQKQLGQQYDSILIQIEKTQESQSYQKLVQVNNTRGQLSTLYAERNRLLEK